jgi:hypothetical protein
MEKVMSEVSLAKIEDMIYVVRGQKVMMDFDLAELYGVETKNLKKAVRRNIPRFPDDFMFEMSKEELENWRFQFGTSNRIKMGLRVQPFVFTELGVAMLSSVLHSEQAISINISIMRIFAKLRSFLLLEQELKSELANLKKGTSGMFKVIFERMDSLEDMITPKLASNRKKIGLKVKD